MGLGLQNVRARLKHLYEEKRRSASTKAAMALRSQLLCCRIGAQKDAMKETLASNYTLVEERLCGY